MDDDTVSVSEAAALLGVHRNTVHYRIQHGHLVGQRIVNSNGESVWRIPKSSLPTVRARGNQRAAIVPKAQHDEQATAIQALLAQFGESERRTGRVEQMHKTGCVPLLLRSQKYRIIRAPVDRDFQRKYRRRFGAAVSSSEPVPAIVFLTASYDVEVDLLSIALAARNVTTTRFDVDYLADTPVLYDPVQNLLYREGLTMQPRAVWARLWHTESFRVSDSPDQWAQVRGKLSHGYADS